MGRSDEPRGSRRRRGRGGLDPDDEFADQYDDFDDFEEEQPEASRSERRDSKPRQKGGGFDWNAVDDDAPDSSQRDWEAADPADSPPPRPRAPRRRERQTLTELCTPVFGFAAVLPKHGETGGAQPDYDTYRKQVLAALQAIEAEAPDHGIDADDAAQAVYALSLYLDGQVLESSWNGKDRWSGEPLHVVLHQDPAGGVNFFNRLEALGDRQRAVKEVYLICLALGFRGKYAELEPTEQATQIGALKQRLLREIHPRPLDQRRTLFPEAYREANPIDTQVPPPPRWWLFASLGTVVAVLVVWLGLFFFAGILPRDARDVVEPLAKRSLSSAPAPVAPAPLLAEPDADAGDAAAEEAGQ